MGNKLKPKRAAKTLQKAASTSALLVERQSRDGDLEYNINVGRYQWRHRGVRKGKAKHKKGSTPMPASVRRSRQGNILKRSQMMERQHVERKHRIDELHNKLIDIDAGQYKQTHVSMIDSIAPPDSSATVERDRHEAKYVEEPDRLTKKFPFLSLEQQEADFQEAPHQAWRYESAASSI